MDIFSNNRTMATNVIGSDKKATTTTSGSVDLSGSNTLGSLTVTNSSTFNDDITVNGNVDSNSATLNGNLTINLNSDSKSVKIYSDVDGMGSSTDVPGLEIIGKDASGDQHSFMYLRAIQSGTASTVGKLAFGSKINGETEHYWRTIVNYISEEYYVKVNNVNKLKVGASGTEIDGLTVTGNLTVKPNAGSTTTSGSGDPGEIVFDFDNDDNNTYPKLIFKGRNTPQSAHAIDMNGVSVGQGHLYQVVAMLPDVHSTSTSTTGGHVLQIGADSTYFAFNADKLWRDIALRAYNSIVLKANKIDVKGDAILGEPKTGGATLNEHIIYGNVRFNGDNITTNGSTVNRPALDLKWTDSDNQYGTFVRFLPAIFNYHQNMAIGSSTHQWRQIDAYTDRLNIIMRTNGYSKGLRVYRGSTSSSDLLFECKENGPNNEPSTTMNTDVIMGVAKDNGAALNEHTIYGNVNFNGSNNAGSSATNDDVPGFKINYSDVNDSNGQKINILQSTSSPAGRLNFGSSGSLWDNLYSYAQYLRFYVNHTFSLGNTSTTFMQMNSSGRFSWPNLPTSESSVSAGQMYVDNNGFLKVKMN